MLIVEIYRRLVNLIPASSFLLFTAVSPVRPFSLPLVPLAIALALSGFRHRAFPLVPSARSRAHTREYDCTCNRISMTVPAGDLTTCHPLYQFTAAGDLGFTHVNWASSVYL